MSFVLSIRDAASVCHTLRTCLRVSLSVCVVCVCECVLLCVVLRFWLWLCQPLVTHAAVCGSSWSRVAAAPALPCRRSSPCCCSIYCVFLMSKLHFIMSPATTKQAKELRTSTKKLFFAFATYVGQAAPVPFFPVNHTSAPCLPRPALHCRLSAFLTLHVAVGASVAVALSLLLLRL